MTTTATPAISAKDDMLAPLFMTLLIVMILFYVDEGFYDFRWMADPGNWIVFCFYMAALYPIQFLITRFLFRKQKGVMKILLLTLSAIGFTIAMMVLFAFL